MTSVLGLDISSFALHGCLLVDDQPPILRMERIGTAKDPLIERVRNVDIAVGRLSRITEWARMDEASRFAGGFWARPDWIVIESAFGHGAHALHLTTGAIIASCPSESQVALISSGDWRKALGAKNTKADGHRWVGVALWDKYEINLLHRDHDEHELDAIGIALAWRSILAGQVAA